ncbi:MAG: ABC transporter ATP-binding protein [Candidatus Limnocylindrales bacterium]
MRRGRGPARDPSRELEENDEGGIARLTGVPWGRLFGYLRPHLRLFAVAVVALLVSTGFGLLLPLVIGGLVNEVVTAGDAAGLDQILLMLVGITLVLAVAGFAQTWSLGVIGERIVARLRAQVFDRLVTLELDFYVKRRVGELISRLSSDVTQVRMMLTQTLTSLLSSLLSLVGSIVVLFLLSPDLLVVILVLAPAMVGIAIVFARPLRRLSTRVQDSIAASTTTAEEALSGIRVVKSFGREEWERHRYGQDLRGVVSMATRLVTYRGLFGSMMLILGFGTLIVLLWFTGHRVIDGTISLGALTSFLLYGITIGTSLSTIAGIYGQFQEGAGAVVRVFEIIDERPTIRDTDGAAEIEQVRGAVSFEGVTFGYDAERPVLRDISLDIAPGEVLAVVGPSGAGKTTFCNLIPRLWDVTDGRVLVDGLDVRDQRLRSLRQAVSLVPQDAAIFGGTVEENIRYGRLEASDEELEAAARAANAHDFISQLPDGYQTVVGDRGTRLSGGQRQRVAIARAILKDAPILILDEATSSLDNESERLVQDALARLMVGRTTVVVAHRLSTIRAADRIAVLDDGWLLELGSHAELIAADGLYAHLWRLQASERPTTDRTEPSAA